MNPFVALQSGVCDPSKGFQEYMTNFEFFQAVTCEYIDPAGLLIVGTLVYGAIGLSIYIRTGSVIIPTVLIFLGGGAILGQVIAPGTAIATVMVLTAGGGVVAYLYYRYSR